MVQDLRPHERWIWTELIGFDNTQADLGVGEYLEAAGFVPDGFCLMLTSPDFVLTPHEQESEIALPADFCARDGHDFNPHRQRQVWTNHQLRALIRQLHAAGAQVFLTVSTRCYGNRFHHEWLSDHPETWQVFARRGRAAAVNCLSRLSDGSYFEDYFIPRLVEVMQAYGFDGWHGADGWGPLSGPIYEVSMSDDMVEQFVRRTGLKLDDVAARPCGDDTVLLTARARWLWRHLRHEWIEFWAERWERFWVKALRAIHASGRRAFINSAWGRAPWEALYRYGADPRRIVAAGVDGMVVETVAAGLAMDPRPYAAEPTRHDDFLSMLMLTRAAVPDAKLIFLHNTHDVVEQWDAIRHIPTVLEKEIYALNNVFRVQPAGLRPCADGFLVCLGDGLDEGHWSWLRKRWELALSGAPRRALGATLVWSDAFMQAQVHDFTATRGQTVHRLLFQLMAEGAPVHATVDIRDLGHATGTILVLNHHLLPADERAAVLDYRGGPVVLIGRDTSDLPAAALRLQDSSGPGSLACLVYGAHLEDPPVVEPWQPPALPEDLMGMDEPLGYWDHFLFRPVSPGFVRASAQVIARVSDAPRVVEQADLVKVMATEEGDGRWRVALKSTWGFYAQPRVDVGRPIAAVDVLTEFPSLRVVPEGTTFTVRIPPRGVTVVAVTVAETESAAVGL